MEGEFRKKYGNLDNIIDYYFLDLFPMTSWRTTRDGLVEEGRGRRTR